MNIKIHKIPETVSLKTEKIKLNDKYEVKEIEIYLF